MRGWSIDATERHELAHTGAQLRDSAHIEKHAVVKSNG